MKSLTDILPKLRQELVWDRKLMLLILGLAGILTYLANAHTLPYQIALSGYSPIDWVNHLRDPGGFAADYPNGTHNYARSLFMHVYPIADKWLGVRPETTILLVLGLEVICLVAGYAYLCRALPGTSYPAVITVAVLLAVASNFGLLEMSRIWRPFYAGLFYNVADAARLAAIVLFLRKRWLPAALFCAFGIATHVIMGGLALLCMVIMACAAPRTYVNRQSIVALVICAGLSVAWLSFQVPSSVIAGEIPYEAWHALTRLMSSHWYTVDLGLLTTSAAQTSIPLLGLSALCLFYLPRMEADPATTRAYAAGVIGMLLLSALGIAFSAWLPHPLLIKLNLQRASMLAITLSTPVVIAGLIQDMKSGAAWILPFAWLLLLSPFIGVAVFPAIAVAAVLTYGIWKGLEDGRSSSYRYWSLGLAALAAILICVSLANAGPGWNATLACLVGGGKIWMYGFILGLLVIWLRSRKLASLIPIAVILTTGAGSLDWIQVDHARNAASISRAAAYRDVQDWARMHTPRNTLFFVDPMIFYGWRDFSQRPSFGNLREWLHTSWGYDSNPENYREGMKRFAEFGLPLERYLSDPVANRNKIYFDFDRRHYSMGDGWREDLAERYGISYFVLEKRKLRSSTLPVAYSNSVYIVLDATKSGIHSGTGK